MGALLYVGPVLVAYVISVFLITFTHREREKNINYNLKRKKRSAVFPFTQGDK